MVYRCQFKVNRLMDRSLLLISFVILSIEHSLGKSVSVDLNLAPEWKAEITKRASDYGNTIICITFRVRNNKERSN